MSTFEFENNVHSERLRGTLHVPGATPGDVPTAQADGSLAMAAGGGSQPGLQAADVLFTEQPTPGTYTATFPVLAGTLVVDVLVYGLGGGGWDSADPLLTVGDTTHGSVAYFNALNLADLGVYAPSLPPSPSGGGAASIGNGGSGGTAPSAYAQAETGTAVPGVGVLYAADDTIIMQVVSTSPVAGADGVTLVRVLYFPPLAATIPTFTP